MNLASPAMTARAWGAFAILTATAAPAASVRAAPMAPAMLPPAALAAAAAPCFAPEARTAVSPASKASAILGVELSALERMRLQQGGSPVSDSAPTLLAQADPETFRPLEPAARIAAPGDAGCSVAPSMAARSGLARALRPDDFLASRRVAIGRTQFDAEWNRVRSENVPIARDLQGMIGHRTDRMTALAAVNRWVNREIAYVEDRDLYRRDDYWAGARRTLGLGKGDCEDIALAKMQLLAAAGIPRADMILTIARDPVRRSDHAVLVVRAGEGYLMLDNTTDRLLDARQSYDYRPVVSLGAGQSWLHGY